MPATPIVRIQGGLTATTDNKISSRRKRSSRKSSQKDSGGGGGGVVATTQIRVETAGSRVSVAEEHDGMTESVNI